MNTHALVPLVAAVAFVPLFFILVFNRPWQRQHKLLLVYLVAAILWSFVDFLFRSDFLAEYKLILVKAVLWLGLWSAVQLLYVVRYFSKTQFIKFPFGYVLLLVLVVLEVLGYVPKSIDTSVTGLHVQYGIWFILIALTLLLMVGGDLYFMIRRLIYSKSPEERNQIAYFLAGISFLIVFIFASFAPGGGGFPLSHVGNLANAAIMSYVFLRHRLLYVGVVLRWGLSWMGLMASGFVAYLIVFFLIRLLMGFESTSSTFVLTMLAASAMAALIYLLRGPFTRGIDRIFYKGVYDYRRKLLDFARRGLVGVLSLKELGEELLQLLVRSLDCQRAYLLLPEAASGDFVAEFIEAKEANDLLLRVRQASPVLERLRQENRYLRIDELDILPEFRGLWGEERAEFEASGIELLFPLVSRDSLIGILALGKKNSSRYTLDDVNLVETINKQVAVGVEREYLQEQLRNREQELSLVNRLTGVISSSLNIREVYGAFVAELKEVVDADFVMICLIDDNELYVEALSSETDLPWKMGDRLPLSGTATEWVASHK